MIILCVSALISAGLTYWLSMKIVTKENMTKIVGFGAACGVTFLVTVGISMPTWAKVAAVAVGGVLGCYFVAGNEK